MFVAFHALCFIVYWERGVRSTPLFYQHRRHVVLISGVPPRRTWSYSCGQPAAPSASKLGAAVLGFLIVCLTQDVFKDDLRQMLDRCLETGRFPSICKMARLASGRKVGLQTLRPRTSLCFFDNVDKLLERVLAAHSKPISLTQSTTCRVPSSAR